MNQKIPNPKVATMELTLLFCAIVALTATYLNAKKSHFSPISITSPYIVAAQTDSEEIFDNTYGEFRGAILASYDDQFPLLFKHIKEYEVEKGLRDGIIVLLRKKTKVVVVKRDELVSLVEVQAGEYYKKKLYVLTGCLKESGMVIPDKNNFGELATTDL
ncbi:hypothetical protein [Telluribacter sp. SYSU D00476]|uniref:hypothetical protein n=1 Tax=Telluribacter sp. SYSU D00476 TaxID=2811430 RepID=UPI001FF67888|nr:hypothetical protein [Telluribacter sp. SYSU D00476]